LNRQYSADRTFSWCQGTNAINKGYNLTYGNYIELTLADSTQYLIAGQAIEDPARFHNKTLTLSADFFGPGMDTTPVTYQIYMNTATNGEVFITNGAWPAGHGRKSVTLNIGDLSTYTFDSNSYLQVRYFQVDLNTGTNGAVFGVSNVQLEEGPVATPFEQRPIGLELSLCQRYYEICGGSARAYPIGGYISGDGTYTVLKRTTPTLVFLGGGLRLNCTFQGFVTPNSISSGIQFAKDTADGYHYDYKYSADAEL